MLKQLYKMLEFCLRSRRRREYTGKSMMYKPINNHYIINKTTYIYIYSLLWFIQGDDKITHDPSDIKQKETYMMILY